MSASSKPPASCPRCAWKSPTPANDAESIARAVLMFQQHLIEAHGVDRREAFDQAKSWGTSTLDDETE